MAIAEQTPDNLSWPRTETDDQGISITLDKPSQRIVSLAPSNTELLFALGLDDRIVGVTDYCDYPEQAAGKDKIGGFSTVSIEKVTALQPDLVFASEGNNPDTVERIRSLGIPVFLVDMNSMEEILKTLTKIGTLTGTSSQASGLVTSLTKRSERIMTEGEKLVRHPTVAHVIWNDPLYASGGETFQDELIRLSGGVNAFSEKESHQIVGVEEFLSKNPDILLINSGSGMGGNSSDISTWFREESRLSGLTAVKDNQIILVDADMADRAGPRLWDLLEEIAPRIRALGQ
jgi:iron complex transport system substrate-binding protein